MKYPNLFTPIKINSVVLKNRIIATPAGVFADKAIGGAGMVIASGSAVDRRRASFVSPTAPYPFDRYQIQSTRERVIVAKQAGAKASLELYHAGQYARVASDDYAIGPSGFIREDGIEVKAMDLDMMNEIADQWAKTAVSAKEIGFDMVMLHFAHGWLPAEFLSPLFNKRTDEFGGSFENRVKFPKMIIERVRAAVGPNFAIDMRISAYEWVEGSIEFNDVLKFIQLVEDKLDMVHISAGLDINHEGNVHMATTIFEPHTPNVHWAAEVKKNVKIPVAVVGAIMTPDEAEEIIASGKADMIALGRPLIADPFWPVKAQEGRAEDIVPCLRCLYCYHIATDRKNVGCAVNPRYGKEHLVPLNMPTANVCKRVVIIGGGPAGIKAALVADRRGHEVFLLEKTHELGGALKLSVFEEYKIDLLNYLKYLLTQVGKSNINIMLNTTATPDMVKNLNPDAIIVAVGANPITPPIKGVENLNVIQALDVYPIMNDMGKSIVIIGGGTIGCELGLELANKGHQTTIIELTSDLSVQGNMLYRIGLRQKMEKQTLLKSFVNTTCKEIKIDGVVVVDKQGNEKFISADNVILATGLKPNSAYAESFYNIVPDTYVIGDCASPRKVMEATVEGYFIASNI